MEENNKIEFHVEVLQRILANPFYAITVHESMCAEHQKLCTEEEFIKVGVRLITKHGAKIYLRNLLENLKGNYVSNPHDLCKTQV